MAFRRLKTRCTRPKRANVGRRPAAGPGSRRPPAAPCALNSLITARHATPHAAHDYAVQILNEPLTAWAPAKGFLPRIGLRSSPARRRAGAAARWGGGTLE